MVSATDPTVLRLSGIGVPPYSARGLSQTLTPIAEAGQFARSINGKLLNLSYEPMRKYKSTITGSDQRPPSIDNVWPGLVLDVDCIAELAIPDGALPFGRDPVDYESVRTEQGFTFYRPRLRMMVINFAVDQDEYGAQVGWSMDLEEE